AAPISPIGRSSRPGIGSAGCRDSPSTEWPRSTRPAHSARPMKPAAPVTRMRAKRAPRRHGLADCPTNPDADTLERLRCLSQPPAFRRGPVHYHRTAEPAATLHGARRGGAAEAPLPRNGGLVLLLA